MRVSVVIRSKDEADRLRLTLASLLCQEQVSDVVVVDDGSSDHTGAVIAEASRDLPLTAIRHNTAQGRCAASNAGANAANGDVLLFLDGDMLADPQLVARHAVAHSATNNLVVRGTQYHLRGTRLFRDPWAGTPMPGEEQRVASLPADELARLRITRAAVTGDFASIARRAQPGIYPGVGPRRLQELELDALRNHPDCSVLWAAASGSNMSVRRDAFLRCGGFHPQLDNNEHRELALKLCDTGERMVATDGANAYHMTHRSGWRDPLQDTRWEDVFYAAHPIPAVLLLAVFWAGFSDRHIVPPHLRIESLPALERAAHPDGSYDLAAARRAVLSLRSAQAA